jgi:uncharacterized protein
VTIALVVLIGIAGGVLAGLFGVGGGIIFVPTLALVLGLTQVHAAATSLLAVIPLSAVGSWRQYRYGNVRLRSAAVIGIGSVIGVQVGVLVAHALGETTLRRLFALFLVVSAVHLTWRTRRA